MKALVIGAGLMGSQIGCEYAIGGHSVVFKARDEGRTRRRVEEAVELADRPRPACRSRRRRDGARRGVGRTRARGRPDRRVGSGGSAAEGLAAAAARRTLAARDDRHEHVVAEHHGHRRRDRGAGAPERTVGTHYWNPPRVMPLVEVIQGRHTEPSVVARTSDALTAIGKRPVVVAQDVPGLIWNRLQFAVMREALWLAEKGVATPETVDVVVREGLARRWRRVGPFAAAALGGAATWRRIGENLLPELSDTRDLEGLEQWLASDPDVLDSLRCDRDGALAAELRDSASG